VRAWLASPDPARVLEWLRIEQRATITFGTTLAHVGGERLADRRRQKAA
jgi:hypothetical protein